MKKNRKKIFPLLRVICVFILLLSCGGGGGGGGAIGFGPYLVSITVFPLNPSIAAGSTLQFYAFGTNNVGTTFQVPEVAWYSSDTSIATVQNVGGLATGVAAGSVTITAWYKSEVSGFISGTTTLSVTP